MIKYTGLEPHIQLKHHVPSVLDKMQVLIPGINHTHASLIGDSGRAGDLTGKQIVDNATEAQRGWLRKQGFIG